ncbi:uncharacterized protein C1orf127 homolog [Rhynchocyon petersi]
MVECFSDYMALRIPRSHVQGLRQWLGRVLHLSGTWRTPHHLDSFLAKCGYFLHPDSDGDFIFQALYSACFVQKKRANYRLEIRILQKGVKSLEQSDGYVMKCPLTEPQPNHVHVRCTPMFIQPSFQSRRPPSLEKAAGTGNRDSPGHPLLGEALPGLGALELGTQEPDPPVGSSLLLIKQEPLSTSEEESGNVSRLLPLGSSNGQTPWLLSLRGELVASLEDASLIGLYVDINATAITIQSPRPELLQRQEVLNTSTEVLPLWLVSGYSAYSLQATCPLVLSQPKWEILVHIPKERLGLVKRGSHVKEILSLQSLQVHQASTFTATESPDFVVVSIPATGVVQVQQCQEGQGAPGMQAFYRVDLSLEFAEMASPVLWTVENFFQCVSK